MKTKRKPSKERGCDGKTKLSRKYKKEADSFSQKHNKRYGVYQCPYCQKYHLTTKIDNTGGYKDLIYVTPIINKQ